MIFITSVMLCQSDLIYIGFMLQGDLSFFSRLYVLVLVCTHYYTVIQYFYFLQGNFVAVGTHRGYVQVWDVMANKRVNVLEGHTARVGALAWNGDNLSSGSRDRLILQRDVRTPPLASGKYISLFQSLYLSIRLSHFSFSSC